jgi:hypothetical protein
MTEISLSAYHSRNIINHMKKSKETVVKKSISLSIIVAEWADALAAKKGFGSNYSAYIADLIRRDRDRDEEPQRTQS